MLLTMVANSRAKMITFMSGVSNDIVMKYRTMMLIKEIDLSMLMVHAQQIEKGKLKE